MVGHFVTSAWGIEHEFNLIGEVPTLTAGTILAVTSASVLFGLTSVLYSQLRHGVEQWSRRLLYEDMMLRAMTGGLALIALTLLVGSRDYLGRGLPMLRRSFEGPVPPFAFLAKLVFTAVTMGTGFRGGEVIPLFFMGATLGNTLGPLFGLPRSFLAAMGMIAVFCGGTNVPITAFIFAMESFQGRGLTYFFLASLVSYITSGQHGVWPGQKIYEPKSRLIGAPAGESIMKLERGEPHPD
ncbi:MAG: chloride channel protein [Bacillota bacterium]